MAQADMPTICPLSGAKWTWLERRVMSAFDPKRTKAELKSRSAAIYCLMLSFEVFGPAAPKLIQNISGPPQGLVGPPIPC
jgi:hypothetical protein